MKYIQNHLGSYPEVSIQSSSLEIFDLDCYVMSRDSQTRTYGLDLRNAFKGPSEMDKDFQG